jgi:sensor histidine kinase YesM
MLPLAAILFLIGKEVAVLSNEGAPPSFKGYLTYLLEIATFFVNLYWVVPLAFVRNKKAQLVVRFASLLVLHHLLRSALSYKAFAQTNFFEFALSSKRLVLTLWQLDRPVFLSSLIGILHNSAQRKQAQQQLEIQLANEKANAARIKAIMAQMQLSPHIMLSGLYYLQIATSSKQPELVNAIKTLSTITRYSLIDIHQMPLVLLTEEIEQIKNRISFHEYIYGRQLHVLVQENINASKAGSQVPPCTLVTLADNVLKYGLLTEADNPAVISITQTETSITFTTRNSKIGPTHPGLGIGQAHVKEILKLYYAHNYNLTTRDTDEDYTLTLTINFPT